MNASLNLSDAWSGSDPGESLRSLKMGVIVVLGLLVSLGNMSVLLVIWSSVSGWSSNSRFFLLSLTGADSLFGLLVMPLNLGVSLLGGHTHAPDALCHVVAFVNATVYSTCMFSLTCISLERYLAVFYPLTYTRLLTRRRARLMLAFSWIFPPFLLLPISLPCDVIQVRFSASSLVCNPSYSTNLGYTLSLTGLIFFPCSGLITFANMRLWCAARRQRLKLRQYQRNRGHNVASRVLVPVMAAYYTCWTPCMAAMIYNAVTGRSVPEWLEFVVVWLPTSSGFFNCIFYFWVNRSFRRKFRTILCRLVLHQCPGLADTLGFVPETPLEWVLGPNIHERSSSVSSTCTLLSVA